MPAFGRYITILLASILLATVVAPEVMAQSEAELKAARRQLAPTIVDMVAGEPVGGDAPVRIRWINTATDAIAYDVQTTTRQDLPPITQYDFASLQAGRGGTGSVRAVGWIAAGWTCPVVLQSADVVPGSYVGNLGSQIQDYIFNASASDTDRLGVTTGLGDGQGAAAGHAARFDSLHQPGYLAQIPGPDYRLVGMLYMYYPSSGLATGGLAVTFARDITGQDRFSTPNLPTSTSQATSGTGDSLAMELRVPVNSPWRDTGNRVNPYVAPGETHRSVFLDFTAADGLEDFDEISDLTVLGSRSNPGTSDVPRLASCLSPGRVSTLRICE